MQSRRNIRIKAMQGIYALGQDAFPNRNAADKAIVQSVQATYNIVLFNLLLFARMAQYVLLEEKNRKQKHLPTEEDKNFSVKLNENIVLRTISDNKTFREYTKQRKLEVIDTDELVRTHFKALYELNEYKIYTITEGNHADNDKAIVLLLYNEVMLKSQMYESVMEEQFPTWTDDMELAQLITKDFLADFGKKPFEHFLLEIISTKEQEQFAVELFNTVVDESELLQSFIEPHLENWDADRIAILDMILMKMTLAEILHFPTIPIKVSINEYIEIAKLYSTPKSKDFINGILDKVMKLLRKEGKITKTGRGLVE